MREGDIGVQEVMKTEVRGDPPVVDERQQWLWQQARGASWVRGDGGGR